MRDNTIAFGAIADQMVKHLAWNDREGLRDQWAKVRIVVKVLVQHKGDSFLGLRSFRWFFLVGFEVGRSLVRSPEWNDGALLWGLFAVRFDSGWRRSGCFQTVPPVAKQGKGKRVPKGGALA